MASRDTILSIKALLDSYVESTGEAYILIVAQGSESTARVISHAMAGFPKDAGEQTLNSMDDAAAGIFDQIAAGLGLEEEDDGPPQA